MRQAMVVRTGTVIPLIGINIFVFILQALLGAPFSQAFALNSATILAQPWTIFTSMFMHGSFSHILFNMYALLMFGPLVEQKIGKQRFLIMYFVSGIVAALGYAFFQEVILGVTQTALGASGAIMGVLGMTIMLFPNMKVLFFFMIPMSMRVAGAIFALIDLVGVFNPNNNVANVAHLAGLATGLLFGWRLLNQKKKFNKDFARPMNDRPQSGFGGAKVHVKVHRSGSKPKSQSPHKQTIDLSDEDIDRYFKYGRL